MKQIKLSFLLLIFALLLPLPAFAAGGDKWIPIVNEQKGKILTFYCKNEETFTGIALGVMGEQKIVTIDPIRRNDHLIFIALDEIAAIGYSQRNKEKPTFQQK